MKSGELGFEGVDLELVDGSGKVVGTARTDFDGFFLFDRVPYGIIRSGSRQARRPRRRSLFDLGVDRRGYGRSSGRSAWLY